MKLLEETLESIGKVDFKMKEKVREKWDKLGKPLGSLGKLEELAIRLGGITGKYENKIDRKAVIVMAGDNGIYEENIASSPKEFTIILVENTAAGITGVSTLAKYVNSDVYVVDVGVDGEIKNPKAIDKKIAYGTNNFTQGPAMTRKQAIEAIEVGIEMADKLYVDESYDILGVGELGIGNTTTSSAILSVLSGLSVEVTCGLGAGLTDMQYENKKRVIKKGIEVNKPNSEDPVDILAKIGGYDIAAMTGVYLSAAKNKKPVVIDGFISSVAALCAVNLKEEVRDYLIPSHLSKEPAAIHVFNELNLEPMLNMDMRLGEGSGCPLAFELIDTALYVEKNMASFEELEIDSSILLDMRDKI